ncbi:MAG: S9 family peptidase [Acidimicrobiia bacterium]
MTPNDLGRLNLPSDPRSTLDGSRTAFVVSVPDLDEDRYLGKIWVADADQARPFTEGPGDSAPRWSADAKLLAFLRKKDEKDKPQVAVMPVAGGEPRVITDFTFGVETLEWSPDGERLVVVAVTPTEEWGGLDEEERKRKPRRITFVPYRFDNKGWTHDRRRHLWLVDPHGEHGPRCLTPGEFDEELPAWSPDDSKVAFISDRDPKRGLVSGNDVWEVDVESGEIARAAPRGFWAAVSYRPDGALHVLGNLDPKYPVDAYLYRRESDGSLTDLTGHLDRGSVSLAAGPAAIRWDGDHAVIGLEDSGRFGVIEVSPTADIDHLVEGDRVVTGFDTHDGGLVFTATTWDSPGELFSLEDNAEIRMTNLNEGGGLELVEPEHFRIGSAGEELDMWAYLPEGEEQVPLLLNIHGGPASQYGFGFFDEFQVYAGAGYGVVASNPRGSAGRGREFTRAVVGEGWGKVDLDDMRAVVAAALDRHPRLDPERMGVMGGSYGGFLTAWIIGHEDRWRSAVVERALVTWTSFAGTSDIGGVFPENYTRESYPDAWETWWRLSPLSIAHQVTTPTLVLHSEDDFRCPIEQAEQYFMALLRNGTPTEFLRFPGEGHEMSRGGKPRHRMERLEAILDWHERHLA